MSEENAYVPVNKLTRFIVQVLVAMGVPTDEPFPYLFDAATSIVPRGKIEVAARSGKSIPHLI